MCLTKPHSPNKATALLFKTQLLFLVERQGAALGACVPNPPCVFCAKPLLVFPSRTHIFQGSDCKSDFNPIKSQLGAETNIGSCYLPRPQIHNSGVIVDDCGYRLQEGMCPGDCTRQPWVSNVRGKKAGLWGMLLQASS